MPNDREATREELVRVFTAQTWAAMCWFVSMWRDVPCERELSNELPFMTLTALLLSSPSELADDVMRHFQ